MKSSLQNRFVDFLFNNGKIISLLFVFLVAAGIGALSQMQRQGFPDVPINYAGVTVVYPNASAQQVEEEILVPIESALGDIEEITDIQSTAGESFGSVVVTIDQKADINAVVASLKNEVTGITFPEDALEPNVQKFSVNESGDFVVAISGYTNVLALYDAGNSLKKTLEGVDGVKEVKATNELTPEVVISFDQTALDTYGLTRSEVEQAIQIAQFKAPVGSFIDITNEQQVSVVFEKTLEDVADIENVMVADGVYVKDVATVETTLNNNDKYNRVGIKQGDNLSIERALLYAVRIEGDADILTVADAIDEKVEELNTPDTSFAEVLEQGTVTVVYSQADQTRLQIEEITQSVFGKPIEALGPFGVIGYLFGGLAFVVVLLFVFMNLRVAILSALAIPLSLFFAAIYLYMAGIALNTLVLFSMVLTIGLVVDPTIVFLESLQRFKERGLTAREAAAKTMETVGFGVFLAVATNVLVFVPFGVVSGFFGEIIKYIPATVIPAMIASMVIPVVFFTPVAAKLLKPRKNANLDEAQDELTGTWFIGRKIGEFLNWILGEGKMKAALRVFLFLVGLVLPVAVGGIMMSTGAVEVVQFSQPDDSDFLIIEGDLEDAWTFEKAVYDVVVPFQEELKNYPEILNFSYFGQNRNDFTVLVTLLPIKERADAEMRTSDEVARDLNEAFKALELEAEIKASTSSEGPPQEAYPVHVRFLGNEKESINALAEDVKQYLADQEGIDAVEDNYSNGTSGGSITALLDNENPNAQNPLIAYGLVSSRVKQGDLGSVKINGTTYDVVSEVNPKVTSFDELARTHVPTKEEMIYLQTLAAMREQGIQNPEAFVEKPEEVIISDLLEKVEFTESTTIQRTNGKRYIEVFASVTEDADSAKIQTDLQDYLSDSKLAEYGLDSSVVDFKGEVDSIAESFTDLFIALGIAIFLIYLLLVGFFRSFIEPFIILFAIPLGLVGVFIAIAITTGQLGFLELLGVVAMAGIVVNVTILLIDYANQLKREGKSAAEAISTAVAVRFRPIVLTQLTAFGSLIPLVYLSPFWKGLAASIIAGIAASAFLSLFMTPILYKWANTWERLVKFVSRKMSARTRLRA